MELRIISMSKTEYDSIMEKSHDINKDCDFWDYPFEELGYLYETLSELDLEVVYMAIIDNRLYELPEDWRE